MQLEIVKSIQSRRGNVDSDQGFSFDAIRDYNEAIRLNPNYALAYIRRGDVYYPQEDYDNAIRDYNEAIKLDPKG